MVLFLTLLVFAGIAAFELPPLLRGRRWRELGVASMIWLLALWLCGLQALHLPVPDVNRPVRAIFGHLYPPVLDPVDDDAGHGIGWP